MFSVPSVTVCQGFPRIHVKKGTMLDPIGSTRRSELLSLPPGSCNSPEGAITRIPTEESHERTARSGMVFLG